MSDFASRLKQLRTDKGLTQSDLAALIKASPSLINLMESGQRKPSLGTLQDLADALGASIDFLVGRSSTPAEERVPAGDGILATAYRRLAKLPPDKQVLADSLLKTMEQQERRERREPTPEPD